MGYRHIKNLYRNKDILLFKECYAMEKIHGTSAHIKWDGKNGGALTFYSGGEKYDKFVGIFNPSELAERFRAKVGEGVVTVYGECYGGSMQRMGEVYGKETKFVVFDVLYGEDHWLNVPAADRFIQELGLEFVHYQRVATDLVALDAERDADSTQAVRNGMGPGHRREGVVLRPLIEMYTRPDGDGRVMAKHKRDDFRETLTPRNVDAERQKVLADAQAIATEWVTEMRLNHVLDAVRAKLPESEDFSSKHIPTVIAEMYSDIQREAAGEIVDSKEAQKAINNATVKLYKSYLENRQ